MNFKSSLLHHHCLLCISWLLMTMAQQQQTNDDDELIVLQLQSRQRLPPLNNANQLDSPPFTSGASLGSAGFYQQQDRLIQPTYVATASRIVRPDSVYRVSVAVLAESPVDLLIKAYVVKGRHQIASANEKIDAGSSNQLLLKIPASVTDGQYRLRVEGYDSSRPKKFIFAKESQLTFRSEFLSIVVQSNRKIFRNEMQIKFRVVMTQLDLRPYSDPVTIYVLDPGGFIMRRWPSRHPTNGVITLSYQLPAFPTEGRWTIRVEAMAQTHDYHVIVERYYVPFFEVIPSAPAYVLDTDESYEAAVTTSFHAGRVRVGNITVRLFAKPVNSSGADFKFIGEEVPEWTHDFTYQVQLRDVRNALGLGGSRSLAGWVIRVGIVLHDFFMGESREGFIETRIIESRLQLRFSGPKTAVFKPGMPFEGNVYVMYDDNQSVDTEKLELASITLRPVVTTSNGGLRTLPEIVVPRRGSYLRRSSTVADESRGRDFRNEYVEWMERQAEDAEYAQFRTSGVYHFRIAQMPKDATSMRITAQYSDDQGDTTSAELQSIAFYSPPASSARGGDFHVHISTSTRQGAVSENAIFHLRANFAFNSFSFSVVSKGLLVHGEQQTRPHDVRLVTFSVPVSTEMAPTFKLVATVLCRANGELIADSVTVPVASLNRYKMNVTMVQTRDHSKETVQVVTRSQPGSFVGVSLLRSFNYIFQADNELTPGRMLRALYDLEPFNRSVHGVTWSDREGMKPDRSQYFVGSNAGADGRRTFTLAGLIVFTDAHISQYPDTINCDRSNGFEPCLAVGCFFKNQRCDGKLDCSDGSDEDACPLLEDDRMDFRIFRRNRVHDFYDWLDGDWAWYDIPIIDDGIEFADRPVAVTNEMWYINAFSVHPSLGFSMLDDVVEYDGTPPFYFAYEAPSSIRRGETLGIRLLVINNLKSEQMALIVLEASDDYKFVETGADGEVEHFRPSLVGGERHHMITVKSESMMEIYMPIAPQIEQGTITVKIRTLSQIHKQTFDIELEILPEGATITRHTSLMLDLKNRAHVLRFLDIPVEESPVIPYSKFRRYVFGSPRASVTLCGDVFGPVLPSTPVSTDSMLSRSLRGTEAHLFNLATTSWSLHYLRLTNQLQSDTLTQGLNDMNVQMADLMRLYDVQGSFKAHTNSKASVWVTAWVVRVLGQSQFQDWENNFFVDRHLLAKSVRWLLSYQNRDGTFDETFSYSFPLDRRLIVPNKSNSSSSGKVGHTAHVLIALSKCSESLEGSLKVDAATAKARSVNYLERVLSYLRDPYEVAIVTHALTLANSPAKETAFGRLHSLRRENEGMVYWSREPVASNGVIYENQRPFVQPRPPTDQDAVAVEASAYALLTYLARDGIGDLQERTVAWLNTMRMNDAGFVSIYDTIVAMEALTEYAYRARLREITDMNVLIEASASPQASQQVKIQSDNLATVHTLEIPNVWGHVNVIGRGAGQAVMQLKVQYGVDWEDLRDRPKRPYFDLFIDETYSHFRNKSHIIVETCVRWLAVDESPTSGAVTLEYELPSGYGYVQSDANQVAKGLSLSFVSDVLVSSNRVVWLFDRLSAERMCFRFQVNRWYPVANMTMYRAAIVYESNSPEHFEMHVFNSTPLYVLDICEVCGSYQCPYCPYFSSAERPSLFIHRHFLLLLLLIIVSSSSHFVLLYS